MTVLTVASWTKLRHNASQKDTEDNMATVRLVVSIPLPEGATRKEVREYVREAVQSMKGSLHPNDPMFYLNWRKVFVSFARKTPRRLESLS
jgi:hypothetical protein